MIKLNGIRTRDLCDIDVFESNGRTLFNVASIVA